mmetsp:Transcript_11270/g.30330  ORF Transcript_11270/g.30330 Transcript_11270/m.30330 type:complete len:208 (-) Transcript_11270:32-655(-)
MEAVLDCCTAGFVRAVGVTDMSCEELKLVLDAGFTLSMHTAACSVIDRRALSPEHDELRKRGGYKLFGHGVLCGGLLSDKYIGVPEPGFHTLTSFSQRRFLGTIRAWGDWNLFQELLFVLRSIGEIRGSRSVSEVALGWLLAQPQVSGVVLDAKYNDVSYPRTVLRAIRGLVLEPSDFSLIDSVVSAGRELHRAVGDCGAELKHVVS